MQIPRGAVKKLNDILRLLPQINEGSSVRRTLAMAVFGPSIDAYPAEIRAADRLRTLLIETTSLRRRKLLFHIKGIIDDEYQRNYPISSTSLSTLIEMSRDLGVRSIPFFGVDENDQLHCHWSLTKTTMEVELGRRRLTADEVTLLSLSRDFGPCPSLSPDIVERLRTCKVDRSQPDPQNWWQFADLLRKKGEALELVPSAAVDGLME